MKTRIPFLIPLLLLLCGTVAQAQTFSSISGTITDPNTGQPVDGYAVEILSEDPAITYASTVFTNAAGQYVDTVPISPTSQFNFKVSVVDSCNNFAMIDSFVPIASLGTFGAQVDFQVCTPGSVQPPVCVASFTATLLPAMGPNSVYELVADIANPNYTYDWSIDGQSIGSNDSVTYTVGNNAHEVCLTVSSSNAFGSCSDTQCDSIFNQQPQNPINYNCFADFQSVTLPNNEVEFFDASNFGIFSPNAVTTIDFGDGNTGTFNGNSITHQYAAAGDYGVCVTVTDGNCTATSCDTVTASAGNVFAVMYTIDGQVTTASITTHAPVNDAMVYLIAYDSLTSSLNAVDSVVLTQSDSGFYSFLAHPGVYFVKTALQPSATDYNSYLPTYFGNSTQWLFAAPINAIQGNVTGADITLIAGANPGGPGFVGGTLQSGANKVSTVDISVEDVEVMLYDVNTNEVVAFTRSDAQGNYSLNVPYGTYRLHAEVLGVYTLDRIITLDANTPSAEDQDIILGNKTTSRTAAGTVISDFAVFPNPARETATVVIGSEATGTANLSLRDNTGRLIYSQQLTVNGNAQHTLPVSELPSGLYHVTLELNGATQHNKLVIQH